jgi:uncharacterized protein YbjT (DUF2867 family)
MSDKVSIDGGLGGTGRKLADWLVAHGLRVAAMSRTRHAETATGPGTISWITLDLADAGRSELETALTGSDVVVYVAGAGYGSSPEAKRAIDRDGAVRVADVAMRLAARRFVLVSSMGAGDPQLANSGTPFGLYLALKGEADDAVMQLDLDWSLVRLSGLTDSPATGHVRTGSRLGYRERTWPMCSHESWSTASAHARSLS